MVLMVKKTLSLILSIIIVFAGFIMIPGKSNALENDYADVSLPLNAPQDSVCFNNHYYKLYSPEYKTWTEAKKYCEKLGGHLATINSKEEDEFLYSYITKQGVYTAYFGFHRESANSKIWRWVTGEQITYTNWHAGEPNNLGGESYGEYYHSFPNGDWNDGDFGHGTSGDKRYFICEWENLPTGIYVSKSVLNLEVGQSAKLSATVVPSDSSDKSLIWTSDDDDIASVSGGTVYANSVGKTFITAKTKNGYKSVCTVYVSDKTILPSGLNLSNEEITVKEGESYILTGEVLPDDTTDKTIKWSSSDDSIATVTNKGVVSGISEGTTIVTAKTVNNIKKNCTVTVKPVEVTRVILSKNNASLEIGDSFELKTSILPFNAKNKNITFYSGNDDIATVDQNGIVTAESGGIAVITAKADNGVYDTCVVNVKYDVIMPSKISISDKKLFMSPGDTYTLEASVTPDDAFDKSVEWKSSNPDIISVEDGHLIAKSVGNAEITATTCNGLYAVCSIEIRILPKKLTFNRYTLTIYENKSVSLIATVLPADATDKSLKWSSDTPKVATVKDGTITALSEGKAIITAVTSNGIKETCLVTVIKKEAESITIDKTTLYLCVGEGEQLNATVLPESTSNKNVTWSTDKGGIVSVSGGYIYALNYGCTTVRARTSNGCSAECYVTVTPYDEETDDFLIDEVKKYTSDNPVTTYNEIVSNMEGSNELKLRVLNELYQQNGFTDARAGIEYYLETDSYRNDYQYLTENDIYCAYNFYDWLNNTTRGNIARGLLYADGLIFNNEFTSYLNPSTYINDDYPGVKKAKEFLREFLMTDLKKVESLEYSKKVGKVLRTTLKINNMYTEDTVGTYDFETIVSNIEKARNDSERDKWILKYSESVQRYNESNNVEKQIFYGKDISKVFGYSQAFISFASSTANDIYQLINLENELSVYRSNIDFLTNIYNSPNISIDMRLAAKYLIDDIDYGYLYKVKSLLSNVFTLGTDLISVDMNLWKEAFSDAGGNIAGALGTLKLATVLTNIMIPVDDFVKNAAYVQGAAEIAALYSDILKTDKEMFLKNQNAENAWRFYNDYTVLWHLRVYGENQYIKLNEIKTILGKAGTSEYILKGDIVKFNISALENKAFSAANDHPLPVENAYVTARTVVSCPVDVNVYTNSGDLIVSLKDGAEMDYKTSQGHFAVVKSSYSGEYIKVVEAQSSNYLSVEILGDSDGYAQIDHCFIPQPSKLNPYPSPQHYKTSGLKIQRDTRIALDSQLDDFYSYDYIGDGSNVITEHLSSIAQKYTKAEKLETSSQREIDISIGEKKLLDVWGVPGNNSRELSWFSDNEKIASVKDGLITAYGTGTAVITAVSLDNDEASLEFTVNVNNEPITPDEDDGLLISRKYPEFKYMILDDGTAQLVKYRRRGFSNSISVPASVDGYKVSSIGEKLFYQNKLMTGVTLPKGIKNIGRSSFEGCENLLEIKIPGGVETIESAAFMDCLKISKFSLPDSIVHLGSNIVSNTAFEQNTDNWENDALYVNKYLLRVNKKKEGVFNVRKGTKCIASSAFWSCSRLTDITIPESVSDIGEYTFGFCSELTKIPKLPKSITRIGMRTFYRCNKITSADIPDNVSVIGQEAFRNCSKLSEVSIPGSVVEIEAWAFADCSKLTQIYIPKNVETIGDYAIGYNYSEESDNNRNIVPNRYKFDMIQGFAMTAAQEYALENDINFNQINSKRLIGDIDGDEQIAIIDATLIQMKLANLPIGIDFIDEAADTDGDGNVTIIDVTYIQRYLAKMEFGDKIGKPL